MKNETPKQKPAYRFNFFDVILIFILIAAIGVVAYFFATGRIAFTKADVQRTDIVYEVEIDDTYPEFKGLIRVGDTVTGTEDNCAMGTVADVVYSDAVFEGKGADGMPVYAANPARIRIVVKIRASATQDEKGTYYIGDTPLRVGDVCDQHVPDFAYSGVCISVTEDKNA